MDVVYRKNKATGKGKGKGKMMKEHEAVMGAIETIVDTMNGLCGVGTEGESFFYDKDTEYNVSFEDGTIFVPTKFSKKGKRLTITLVVGFDYI